MMILLVKVFVKDLGTILNLLIQNLVERTTGVRASESWLEDLMRQGSGLPSGYGQGQVRRPLQRECRVIRQSHGRFVHARAGTRYTPARETC